MRDDDDGGNRPEDPTAPELGTDEPPGPPRPSTDAADYPPEERAAWAEHYDEVEQQVYGEEGDDAVAEFKEHLAQVRAREPPR